jgi:hypothetical protein
LNRTSPSWRGRFPQLGQNSVGQIKVRFSSPSQLQNHTASLQQCLDAGADVANCLVIAGISVSGAASLGNFGGIYSTSTGSFQAHANPFTSAASCPPGFVAQNFAGAGYKDNSGADATFQLFYCVRTSGAPLAAFGGIYSTSGSGSFQGDVNQYTGQASCPAGLTAYNFAGAGYKDANGAASDFQMFFCAQSVGAPPAGTDPLGFGGIFSTTTGGTFQAHANPATGSAGCPSPYQALPFGGGGYTDESSQGSSFQLSYCGVAGSAVQH